MYGDLGSIPGLGRSPGEGKGYPLQYSGLENFMDYTVHGVTKSWTQLSDFHSLTHSHAALITAIKLLFIIMNSIITVRSFSSPVSCFCPSSTHWINYHIRRVWGTQPEHPLAREKLRAIDSKCVIFLWWRCLSMQNPW